MFTVLRVLDMRGDSQERVPRVWRKSPVLGFWQWLVGSAAKMSAQYMMSAKPISIICLFGMFMIL
jgi:hypothetical protein